ncbi:MBL fold metallo-hydrolase [Aquincola sp. S2]|uniref:MBL fold metallo-hydrolase n=1 Tax=Pseudaquabacterium terrae TaxID=2732868 RepID=A0ABX2EF76_9BURK|nr:MBL fold metallo-hydrolase [Aquabacterium terrae]NRF67280.1 MBL fold metallo-hydrolase [Aquabacterium terrae]
MKTRKKVVVWLLSLAAALAVGAWLVVRLPSFGGVPEGARLERMRQSKQFHGTRFENTPPYESNLSFVREMKSYFGDEVREPQFEVPVVRLPAEQLGRPVAPGLRAWWLGHASVLLEIDGVRILTDPVLSRRVSPFQFAGPARQHPAPLAIGELKNVDAVVISHDHFDHLDMDTVQALGRGGTHFYVGLGIGAHLERWEVPAAQIHEMDWWDSAQVRGVTIHCTPARHYSGRKSMNNSTLWASWLLKGPNHSAYFSGDTGYADHFKAVRERLGAPQLSMIKIGAYGDTWLDIHMSPESAIQAHRDLDAGTLLPVHWGTFNLAYHAWDEPMVRAVKAAKAQGVQIVTPRPGEKFEVGAPFVNQAWYSKAAR